MSTPILVFTHANSFPPGCYRLLTEAWQAAGWRVLATPMLGHQAQHPVTANWTHLADELLAFVDRELPKQQPVAWVGHSLGGLLSLMAAARRPAQSRAVVQLDSPYVRGWRAGLVRLGSPDGPVAPGSSGRHRAPAPQPLAGRRGGARALRHQGLRAALGRARV
jgi:pimeloyl-ACP methyl ester carboxylesterase